jgi:predicted peptidase
MKRLFLILLIGIAFISKAQDFSLYRIAIYKGAEGQLPYRILDPIDFDSTKSYPLIIFLHGAFEKGNDNVSQLNIGGRYFLREENRKNYPLFVLFPQCPLDDSWAYFENKIDSATGLAKNWNFPFLKKPAAPTGLLKKLLDSLLTLHFIDKSRIYIGGLSQGGMGVYDIVARYPEIFAAAFPICGAGKANTAKNFAGKTALWIFHGDKDDIVPVFFSRDYYNRLKKLNADVRYSEYHGVFHNSWVNAFGEKELLPWLFSKSKKQ